MLNKILKLAITCFVISGCSPNISALTQNIVLPDEFLIENFKSFSDRSSLHSTMYLSFSSNEANFKNIVKLNKLKPIVNIPNNFKFVTEYIIGKAEQKAWPELGDIDDHHVFSNHQALNVEANEYPILLMLIYSNGTAFAIVSPLY